MNNSTFSIYEIDSYIEKLEEIIDSFSVELELLYFERGMFGGTLTNERQEKLEKFENIVLEKSCELDQLYFHRHLVQNKRKYLY
jgi:ribosomal protein S2